MDHKSFDELSLLMNEAVKKVEVNGIYRHYKHLESRYKVKGLCILEVSDSVAVRYVSLLYPAVEFIRPLENWLDSVERQGKTVDRFTLVKQPTAALLPVNRQRTQVSVCGS
jgi:hypothetical protein